MQSRDQKGATEFFVFHGGSLNGQGRWSGPHATRSEAEQSREECARVCGGSPAVVEQYCDPNPYAGMTGPESYYHGPNERRYQGD